MSARRSAGLRKYWRTVKRIRSRVVKLSEVEGRKGTAAARRVYSLSKSTGLSYSKAFFSLQAPPAPIPAPIVPQAPPPGRIILEGDISWTGLFSFLPGEQVPPKVEPKGPEDPYRLSSMPEEIRQTVKDEAEGLKNEVEGISTAPGGLVRGDTDLGRPGRGEVFGRYGASSTAPEWFQKLSRSRADVQKNLEKIIENDPKNELARKLVKLIVEMKEFGRFEGRYEMRPGDEEFQGYWEAYTSGEYGTGGVEFLEPGVEPGQVQVERIEWNAAELEMEGPFSREFLHGVRDSLDESLSIETDSDSHYNVWRVYDLFHYVISESAAGNVLSVSNGPMLNDWGAISRGFK